MQTYEEAIRFLNKRDELSITDIQDIHNDFVKKLIDFDNLSIDKKEKEILIIKQYLNAMNIVFCSRYKNSQMTPEEYEIWKLSLKDDFKNISISTKIEIKNLFINKIAELIKKNILKGNNMQSYDEYLIENIGEIKFNKAKIRYKSRFIIMLLFFIGIILVSIFVR